ncbi:glycosyltransferase [Rhizobiales bacterium]|uniref:glycosyltransferase family 2 protein n=1 Tax=Hongsoonwoonella zoysiae TaxID=2821844 RepID=UPI00156179CF|nr:glycosyltransferase family 2 protein [Hongsoonwoonella zoysiae]NRG18531.1 glycosyltransferase [Hongsoonwoonella zoysiae]
MKYGILSDLFGKGASSKRGVGSADYVSADRISGWWRLPASAEQEHATIRIHCDGQLIGTAIANQPQASAVHAERCGFRVDLNWPDGVPDDFYDKLMLEVFELGFEVPIREIYRKSATGWSLLDLTAWWFGRTMKLRLVPERDAVEPGAAHSVAGGDETRIRIETEDNLLPGWYRIRASMDKQPLSATPRLQVAHDAEWRSVSEHILEMRSTGMVDTMVRIEGPVNALHIDTLIAAGTTYIEEFRLRRIGTPEVMLGAFRHAPRMVSAALFWRLLGKKVRARNRLRSALSSAPFSASRLHKAGLWWQRHGFLPRSERELIRGELRNWKENRPCFAIVLTFEEGTAEAIDDSIRSLQGQLYPEWRAYIVVPQGAEAIAGKARGLSEDEARVRVIEEIYGTADALNVALADLPEAGFVGHMIAGDRLMPDAFFRLAQAVRGAPDLAILYTDQALTDAAGRVIDLHFKSGWNEELFLHQDYIDRLAVIRVGLARKAGGYRKVAQGAEVYDMILRASLLMQSSHIQRIARPLILTDISQNTVARDDAARGQAPPDSRLILLSDYLALRPGPKAEIRASGEGRHRVVWPLPKNRPFVSLIVPTRDRLDLLKPCIDGLLNKTEYSPKEILIVDNDSRETETISYFKEIAQDPRVRVISCPGPFNYAAMNNLAVDKARGEYIGLINNDIEVLRGSWLEEMMRHAVRPEGGAVGAKLLYPDGRIQHGGVICGLGGLAGHGHRFAHEAAPGYFGRLNAPQYLSAVTAACLVVEKRKFLAVGGLEAEQLKVAFNDVDLCLKLQAAGWKNIYTPEAVLVHHESVSRGHDLYGEKAERYRREAAYLQGTWRTDKEVDRYYNPNLTHTEEDFSFTDVTEVIRELKI